VRPRAIFTFGDDAAYLLLARSLRGFSYRELQFVGDPIAARFPPVYPAVLALSGAVLGERLDVFTVVTILFSVSAIWALFDVVRRRWSPDAALVVAALVAINPALLDAMSIPASESVFTSFLLWTLWAADRFETSAVSDGGNQRSSRFAIMATIMSVLTAMTRTAGAPLLLALFAHWTWRRRWRAATIVAFAGAISIGGWLTWTTVAPAREVRLSYIDDAVRPTNTAQTTLPRILAKRVAFNVPTYITQVSLTLLPAPVTPRTQLDNVGWVLLLGSLFLIGLWAAWRRWQSAAMFVIVYCGLLAVWPYLLDRFLIPIVPLGLTFIVLGAVSLGHRLRAGLAPLLIMGAMLSAFALGADADLVTKWSGCDRTRADCATATSLEFVDAAKYAARVTPASSRFIAPKSPTLFYFSGRQSVYWEEAIQQDTTTFLRYLRDRKVTHVILSPVYADYETLLRLVASQCERFAVVRSFSPHTLLMAFRDSAATPAEGARACGFVQRARATAKTVVSAVHFDGDLLGSPPRRVLADKY
jgi:hypothetical protein